MSVNVLLNIINCARLHFPHVHRQNRNKRASQSIATRLPDVNIDPLAEVVKDDEVVKRLTSVLGVGPVTATTYAATLDGAARFQDAKQVRSYLGLVPREHSSGEKQHRGRISKAGNSRARSLLVEAVWALLRWKTPKTEALHDWATRIAARRGKATAVVALARKMAGTMFAIWRDGTEFNPEHPAGRSSAGAVAGA